MKRCIWCLKNEEQVSFNKLAHTIPQSLGGRDICQNVCDSCNAYFGSPQKGKPSIEVTLKEALNISRFHLLNMGKPIGRGHSAGRYKSTYFNTDFKGKVHKITLKQAYSLRPHFQEVITRQLKRGLYKVFLEETERQKGNALEDRFDFIREFARYDLNDCPVLHFERSVGVLYISKDWIAHPQFFIEPESRSDYLLDELGFFDFEILGHVFAIASSRLWNLTFELYIKKSLEAKHEFFNGYRLVEHFNDVDLTLNRAFDDE